MQKSSKRLRNNSRAGGNIRAKRVKSTQHEDSEAGFKEIPGGDYVTGSCHELDMHDSCLPTDANPKQYTCFGALVDAKLQTRVRHDLGSLTGLPWESFHAFKVSQQDEFYYYATVSIQNPDSYFAILDLVTTTHLNSLQALEDITYEAIISSTDLKKIPRTATRKVVIIDVTINIYGPEDLAERVGDILTKSSAYLQHPVFLLPQIRYVNPHYFYPANEVADLRHLVGPRKRDSRSARVSQALDTLLDSLGNARNSGDLGRLPSEFTVENFLRDTQLKRHQVDGIRFILNRENADFCYRTSNDLLSLIDPTLISQVSVTSLGGILADAMGLGKTLTMLSAVVCSKYADRQNIASSQVSGPTLIVLPSRQVLDVWDFEIRRHFKQGTLNHGNFHGDDRAKTSQALSPYDVVLTTYQTLAADFKNRRVLHGVGWLRIVLDEAHCIRNSSTLVFKATESLRAERRWCLTGTPIQNSLQDLRSLLKFLCYVPLANSRVFEKYIIDPLRAESDDSFCNLRLLLRVICLRRTDACLDLPPLVTKVVPITLSQDESTQYHRILEDCKSEFDRQVCAMSELKNYNILFATIMRLRRLCNHGTLSLQQGEGASLARTRTPYCQDNTEAQVQESDVCEFCSPTEQDIDSLLDGQQECPLCGRSLVNPTIATDEGAAENFEPTQELNGGPPTPETSWTSQTLSGFSSKLLAVAQNISSSCAVSGSKSIVFTSWRLTLDLLEATLSRAGIYCLRIDGRTHATRRSAILSQFQTDPAVRVLLMTIDSGAVGLTLTNADRVHIVEPQWNPAVEAQAIARARRMGQTRTVTVVKYVTESTVEKNIVFLQDKKTRLAKFSLDDNTDGSSSGALDDLKFVLDPNS
ncbi:SNF2 family N-terminal domain-containing protein [Hypomontagnella monticulosa]|nr:SNF2 family N-terminal domain-containing protein [Hypomontagnella monticulosa]